MGWDWLEEALDEEAGHTPVDQDSDEPSESEDSLLSEIEPEAPDPAREGIDWVRDETGRIVHPLQKRAKESLYRLLDELRSAGNPQERHDGLGDFAGHFMTLGAKLAGALASIARGPERADYGLTIASLKRALDVLHQALTAAGTLGPDTPFPAERLAYYRDELFAIRQEMLALMAKLRET